MPKALTDKHVAEIRALYAGGMTQQAIAAKFGVSRSTIQLRCKGIKDVSETCRTASIPARKPIETEAWKDFMKRRHEIPKGPVTLNQALLGDPEPGRSALDRR